MRRTFGIGIDPDAVAEVRAELKSEIAGAVREHADRIVLVGVGDSVVGPQAPPAAAERIAQVSPAGRLPSGDDVQTGLELLVSAIPNLQWMEIVVSDEGEVSYSFEVRAITKHGGKITVKR